MSSSLFSQLGTGSLIFGILLISMLLMSIFTRSSPRESMLFPYILGSFIAFILIVFVKAIALPELNGNPYLVGLGVVVITIFWKFLFGPSGAGTKAMVLGTFIFWVALNMFGEKPQSEQVAMLLAAAIAIIPAGIWCVLFLKQHRERLSVVILTFFAGMLSTAPILFYDYVVRRGAELNFFLFRITPEHFTRSSETFVEQSLTGNLGIISASLATSIVSFAIVGIIEEWSKNWVIRKSDRSYFHSINDVMQLSIIAAIGFAFAENIVNPNYFIAFIKSNLIHSSSPQWGGFLGSVLGRSIITNMVHITSSGILGYYYGIAFFARPVLEEERARGKKRPIFALLQRLSRISRVELFREWTMVQGLVLAMGAHSLFDLLVSLPDVIPTHPQTIGELFGFAGGIGSMSLVIFPAVTYVFGGWFLLMFLFQRRQGLRDFGYKYQHEVFVSGTSV